MEPVYFKEYNAVYAENQPEYLPLPVYKADDGMVISCWKFSWKERMRILLGAKLYWSQLTFKQPLQPCRPSLDFSK